MSDRNSCRTFSSFLNDPRTADVVISEFYIHSDTCFTCHVSFAFVLMTSKGEQTYPTAYTFCIVRQGGKGKLYNLLMQ